MVFRHRRRPAARRLLVQLLPLLRFGRTETTLEGRGRELVACRAGLWRDPNGSTRGRRQHANLIAT